MTLLFESSEWDFDTIQRIYDACEIEAKNLNLNWYPNQLEIINSEQMVDAYSSIGLPIMYHHWSFGKHFSKTWNSYRKGYSGLAYEIVINSSPCIAYLMEQNSSTMQALVTSHACFGHNHFFKNNYLFKQWTDAESILEYLKFAKNYIETAERLEGQEKVSNFLNSCHALMNYGVNRYKKPRKLRVEEEKRRSERRKEYADSQINELYKSYGPSTKSENKYRLQEPEENILYYCEKNSPTLEIWQKECIRIVRKLAEYFYPQPQTKVMNEGCATTVHYKIMTRLHDLGKISDGNYLEFLASHANVVYQPNFDSKNYNGLNPYKLGQEIFRDIERICKNPTEEDKYYSPYICNQDANSVFLDIVANYRDESFIRQFLSPKLIRDFRLFHLVDKENSSEYYVNRIHNEEGYSDIKEALATQYEREYYIPKIEVIENNKTLTLRYSEFYYRKLDNMDEMIKHIKVLWGEHVAIVNETGGSPIKHTQPSFYEINHGGYY
jgi:spore cortex formation protein SpoVR/YcgB (stage V sporulation)